MRVKVHVERVTIETTEQWVDVPISGTHDDAYTLAAYKADNGDKEWKLVSQRISRGIGSYIIEREK